MITTLPKSIFSIMFMLKMVSLVSASSPATPYRYIISNNAKHCVIMMPASYKLDGEELIQTASACVSLHKLTTKGTLQKLWSVPCDYSFPGSLPVSRDGKTLIQKHSDFSTKGEFYDGRESQAILIFYRRGQITATYTAKDLVNDFEKGLKSNVFGGFDTQWVKSDVIEPSNDYVIETKLEGVIKKNEYPEVYQLTTLEGVRYFFDLKTGSMLFKKNALVELAPVEDANEDPFE